MARRSGPAALKAAEEGKPLRYAACDVGSNAVRLFVARVYEGETPFLRAEASYRVPLRLGHDVFTTGEVSPATVEDLVQVFRAFSALLDFFRPEAIRACATSALREARNGPSVVSRVRRKTGVPLEIITGAEEAGIIFSVHAEERMAPDKDWLYVDVGGGSTELTFLQDGRPVRSESFRLGGVRLLAGRDDAGEWDRMKFWIAELPRGDRPLSGIGTGGNIGKLHDLSGTPGGKPMSRRRLKDVLTGLEAMTVEERIRLRGLKPDRADVIVHAGRVYHQALKWAGAKDISVPRMGLADGLLEGLFESRHGGRRGL